MTKRNAIRVGNPHESQSIAYTVRRYGAIQPDTLGALVEYLESPKGKEERTYEVIYERIEDEEGELIYPTIKTIRKGSAIFKVIDNEHDAQNTLANIRNRDFPKDKQGQ